jgi:hypothetical protein
MKTIEKQDFLKKGLVLLDIKSRFTYNSETKERLTISFLDPATNKEYKMVIVSEDGSELVEFYKESK